MVLMKQQQRHLCCDAQVLRWMDHKLLQGEAYATHSTEEACGKESGMICCGHACKGRNERGI